MSSGSNCYRWTCATYDAICVGISVYKLLHLLLVPSQLSPTNIACTGTQEWRYPLFAAALNATQTSSSGCHRACFRATDVAGQPRLIVAAGKAGGALLTCRVSQGKAGAADSSSAGSVLPQLHCSQVCLHRGAHSSRNVTGVAWASADLPFAETLQKKLAQQQPGQAEQPRRQQQQQALLISSGADGKIRRWAMSLDESSLGLVEAECPAAWSRPSLEKDAAFDPLGVAVSGNGLFLAVAADNGTTAVAAVQ